MITVQNHLNFVFNQLSLVFSRENAPESELISVGVKLSTIGMSADSDGIFIMKIGTIETIQARFKSSK